MRSNCHIHCAFAMLVCAARCYGIYHTSAACACECGSEGTSASSPSAASDSEASASSATLASVLSAASCSDADQARVASVTHGVVSSCAEMRAWCSSDVPVLLRTAQETCPESCGLCTKGRQRSQYDSSSASSSSYSTAQTGRPLCTGDETQGQFAACCLSSSAAQTPQAAVLPLPASMSRGGQRTYGTVVLGGVNGGTASSHTIAASSSVFTPKASITASHTTSSGVTPRSVYVSNGALSIRSVSWWWPLYMMPPVIACFAANIATRE
jgi:hypothetical protein